MIRDKNHLLNSDQKLTTEGIYEKLLSKIRKQMFLQSHNRSGIALFLLMVLHWWLSYLLCLGSVRKTKIKTKSSKKHAEIKPLDVSHVIICLVCSSRFIMIN